MRKLALLVVAPLVALVVTATAFAIAWLRDRRTGARLMNTAVNPFLVGRRLSGGRRSEVGIIEHIGRRSGVRRVSPIHPTATVDGFRIIVPLGPQSQWARNVVAAGHCRMQLHDTVYELDEPALVTAADVREMPAIARFAFGRLGFQFLLLHRFSEHAGSLEPIAPPALLDEPAWAPEVDEVERAVAVAAE